MRLLILLSSPVRVQPSVLGHNPVALRVRVYHPEDPKLPSKRVPPENYCKFQLAPRLRASFIIPQNCTAVHNRHLDKLQEPEKRKIRTVLLYFCTLYFCRCFFFMNLHLYIFPHRDGLGTLVALVTGTPKNVGFAALPFGSSCSIGTWGQ